MLPPDQDMEKQEAAADKRREAAQADLASVKAQLEGAEATVSRLQTDKEKALSELHAKQGACSPSDRQLLHITQWIRQKMPPRIRQAAETGLCQQASVSQKAVLHVLCRATPGANASAWPLLKQAVTIVAVEGSRIVPLAGVCDSLAKELEEARSSGAELMQARDELQQQLSTSCEEASVAASTLNQTR